MTFPFGEPTPEQIKELEEQVQMTKLAWDEFRHGVQRLFEELPEDQLSILASMLNHLTHCEQPELLAASWGSYATWELKKRFNICASCGVNHDKEFQVEHPNPEPETSEDEKAAAFIPYEDRVKNDGTIDFTSSERALMTKYHLDDAYDEDTKKFIGFMCTGIEGMRGACGIIYPSLDDRMIKEPEDCHGCHVRMMHG